MAAGMTTGMRAAAPSLSLALLVLACGAGAPPPPVAAGAAATAYFPLVPEARWVYQLDPGELVGVRLEVVGRGLQVVRGREGQVFITDEISEGADGVPRQGGPGLQERAPVGYVVLDGYLGQLTSLDYDDDGSVRALSSEDPQRVLPLDPKAGLAWDEETRIFELPEGGGGTVHWKRRTELRKDLSVPAGTFRDVLVVESEYWDPAVSSDGPLLRYEDYYARGVGLLRSVTYDVQNENRQVGEQTLLSYRFPGAPTSPTP